MDHKAQRVRGWVSGVKGFGDEGLGVWGLGVWGLGFSV